MKENKIDYQLLGAIIGSSWRDSHPKATLKQGFEARRLIEKALDLRLMASVEGQMFHAMMQSMEGRCAFCGSVEVGRDERGVYCCFECRGNGCENLLLRWLRSIRFHALFHFVWR